MNVTLKDLLVYELHQREIDRLEWLRFCDSWQAVGMAAAWGDRNGDGWRISTCLELGIPTDERLMTGEEFLAAMRAAAPSLCEFTCTRCLDRGCAACGIPDPEGA